MIWGGGGGGVIPAAIESGRINRLERQLKVRERGLDLF